MIYFTSDNHFNHEKIIKYCDRPFKNAAEMNVAMLKGINDTVGVEDELYILGDFCFGGWSNVITILNQITCKNLHYVFGNHDKNMKHDNIKPFFKSMSYYTEIWHEKQLITAMHYPILEWNQGHRGSWMLHGHTHNTLNLPDMLKNKRIKDVGVDVWGFKPVSFDQLKDFMKDKVDIDYGEAKLVPKEDL